MYIYMYIYLHVYVCMHVICVCIYVTTPNKLNGKLLDNYVMGTQVLPVVVHKGGHTQPNENIISPQLIQSK